MKKIKHSIAQDFRIGPLADGQKAEVVGLLCKCFNQSAEKAKEIFDTYPTLASFTALVEGHVVGVIRCTRYNEQYFSIYSLAVDERYRQQGIGHALMKRMEDFISEEYAAAPGDTGEGVIILSDETKKADPSSRFYEKMGYGPEEPPRFSEENVPMLEKRFKRSGDRPGGQP